jgi:hypothetical protein
MRGRNLTKPFSIAGFVLGEVYMLATVLAPLASGSKPPWDYLLGRVAVMSIFFGCFGALVGLGVGLLVGAWLPKR